MVKKYSFLLPTLFTLLCVTLLVYFIQQKQEIRSNANKTSTVLYLTPETAWEKPLNKKIGEAVPFDIMINPGTDSISIVRLEIVYDSSVLKPADSQVVVPEKNTFPVTVEGPVMNNNMGKISVTYSIGAESEKAVKTTQKIATLNLVAYSNTENSVSVISFSDKSAAYSMSPSSHAYQNVLITARPGYIYIGNSPFTPGPSQGTPAPEASPTVTPVPTKGTPLPTPTPNPSVTNFSSTICLHGIGNSGDNTSPSLNSLSNKYPKRIQRDMIINVFNSSSALVASKSANTSYDYEKGCYAGMFTLNNYLPNDVYTVKLIANGYLQKRVQGSYKITTSPVINLPTTSLVTGDLNIDNKLNILDYNLLMGCYSDLTPAPSCKDDIKTLADLNDDVKVNQIDYNLFLREISVQSGD